LSSGIQVFEWMMSDWLATMLLCWINSENFLTMINLASRIHVWNEYNNFIHSSIPYSFIYSHILFVWFFVCLCVLVCLFVCLSDCLFVCLCVCLFVCAFVCFSVCLFVCLFICLLLSNLLFDLFALAAIWSATTFRFCHHIL